MELIDTIPYIVSIASALFSFFYKRTDKLEDRVRAIESGQATISANISEIFRILERLEKSL